MIKKEYKLKNYEEEPREESYPGSKATTESRDERNVMALHNERRPLEKKIMLFEPRIFSDAVTRSMRPPEQSWSQRSVE